MIEKLTDNSIVSFGKYKGYALANIPASYLVYIYENNLNMPLSVKNYIKDNLEHLKLEIKQAKKNESR